MYLIVSHVSEFGGAERVLLHLAKALAEEEKVEFLVPPGALAEKLKRIQNINSVLVPPVAKKDNNNALVHVWNIIRLNIISFRRARSAKVYVINAPRAFVYLMPSYLFAKCKKACFAHDVVAKGSYIKALVFFIRKLTDVNIIPVSQAIADSLGIDIVNVLHNPVFRVEQRFVSRKAKKKVKIGVVTNIAEWKGHSFALESIAGLLRKDADVSYEIYGSMLDDSEKGYFDKLQKQLDTTKGAYYKGYTSDPVGVYKSMDIVLQSSLRSEQPLTLAEAISAGCHIVSPGKGGEAEVIRSWPSTKWYSRGDSDSLSLAVGQSVEVVRQGMSLADESDYRKWLAGYTIPDWISKFKALLGV
jgi:glycosyltransferase involved in cell wall biosynthesis